MATTDYRGFSTKIKIREKKDSTIEVIGVCFKTEYFYGELHDTNDPHSYWILITSALFNGNEILPVIKFSGYMYGEIFDALPSGKALYEAQESLQIKPVPIERFKIEQSDLATCAKIKTMGELRFDYCTYQLETADGEETYSYLKDLSINGKSYKEYKNRKIAESIYVDYADELNMGTGEADRVRQLVKYLKTHHDKKLELV